MQTDLRIGDRDIILDQYNSKVEKSITVDNIVAINLTLSTNNFVIREECDQYYTWDLTKEELIQFIKLMNSHFELELF